MIASITIPLKKNKISIIKLVRWLGYEPGKPVEERSPFYSLVYAKHYVEGAIGKAVANVIHLEIPTHRTEEEIESYIDNENFCPSYLPSRPSYLPGITFNMDWPAVSLDEFEKEL